MREEALLEQFGAMLDRIDMTEPMFQWLTSVFERLSRRCSANAMRWSSISERTRAAPRARDKIYIGNLDGRVEETIFNALTAQFREQERKVARGLELRFDSDLGHMDDGIALLSIARDVRIRLMNADLAVKKNTTSGGTFELLVPRPKAFGDRPQTL